MKDKKTYYSFRSFALFAMQHKPAVFWTLLVFFLSSAAIASVPLLIGQLVQAASTPGNNGLVMLYVWLLVAASSGHDILWRAGEIIHRKYIHPLSFAYETMLFQRIIEKPYPYFVDKFSGKISSYITTITGEFRNLLFSLFYAYVPQMIGIVSMVVIFATVNWQTCAIFIIGVICMFFVGKHTLRESSKAESVSTDMQATKNGHIIDSIANFPSVKSFQKELGELRTLKKSQATALEAALHSYWRGIIFWASMSLFVRHLIWPTAILLNIYLFFHGQITLGQLTTLLSTILLFASTVWDIIWQLSQVNLQFARAEEAHRYLFGEHAFTPGTDDKPKSPSKLAFKKSITFHDLSFAYPDKPDALVLKDISLTIKKGEKVGIVGRSGGGKTTLVKLLLDYYTIGKHMLQVDGKPVSPKRLAGSVAYVPQDTSLFHRSIADNISYAAKGDIPREEVVKAAKKAHAHEFITQIDGGYDALVGERGVKLSGGQRQRIAIARAIVKDAPILILDEATSALDSENELLIQKALWELMKGRTALVIAHRLSTIQKMDRIIVLDGGKIVEQGSHAELLAQKGVYAMLWSHQSGGFIEE